MKTSEERSRITLLDGGMGRELVRLGAPFRQPEWSALALMEAPDYVKKAHENFSAAGSAVLTTSNYAVVPFHLGEKRFADRGAHLTSRAGRIARSVADASGCTVAGSVPPLFGSYRPDLFVPERAPEFLKVIVESLSAHVDFWLAETLSSTGEAHAVAEALAGDDRPLWLAFTLSDDEHTPELPRLRSGQSVRSAVQTALELEASALLFNCSQPEVMSTAVDSVRDELVAREHSLPIGVYANAFPPLHSDAQANSELHEIRADLDPLNYLYFAADWCARGATIIGGCCGIGPEHIAVLRSWLEGK